MLKSLEQNRAKYAWKYIEEVKSKDNKIQEKYKSYVKNASTYIQNNGLANTLAFYISKFGSEIKTEITLKSLEEIKESSISKEKMAYLLLYKHITNWFNEVFTENSNEDILKWIIDENTSAIQIVQVTREIIKLLNWMKRFAEAELAKNEENKVANGEKHE